MKRILIVKTGGTLVMQGEPLEPTDYAETLIEHVPEIKQLAKIDSAFLANIDSSDIDIRHWEALIDMVSRARENYDGVVIVHGTDTMAYTASALAFGLESLDIPVVLTGSQRPLAAVRSDARRNLADAIELATTAIPEVGICFDGLFLRGCRATKAHGHEYRAFASPGLEPLATLGVDIAFSSKIRRPEREFQAYPIFNDHALLFHLTPGLPPQYLENLIESSKSTLRGLVIGSFGLGTIPHLIKPLTPILKDAIDAGIDVMVVSQATGRVVLGAYKNSRVLEEIGAISGGSMGYEAAITKMMHALGRFPHRDERRAYLESNVVGESD